MSRKEVIDECRICKQLKKLTYEHVPPKVTFNNRAAYSIEGDAILEYLKRNDGYPWEMEGIRKKIHQQGRGGMFLCGDCNSLMGKWYVPYYSNFVRAICQAMYIKKDEEYQGLVVKIKEMYPLAIIKQVIAMFCDINKDGFVDESITSFLLNKDNREFDSKRYRIYMHIYSGTMERMNGFSTSISISPDGGTPLVLSLSEISVFPVGFTLYENLPENYTPEGVEITSFLNWKYDDRCIIELNIPKLECNTPFSGDYRDKGSIMDKIKETEEVINNINVE